jgi:hypothetical protein
MSFCATIQLSSKASVGLRPDHQAKPRCGIALARLAAGSGAAPQVPLSASLGEAVTELRSRTVKDRTATERKRRSRARKRNHRDNPSGHAVTVTPVALSPMETVTSHAITRSPQRFETNQEAIDVAAFLSAVTLAGSAAWFSIKGMTVLFPGAPVAVVTMAIAMEAAKLVTAGWLAQRWRAAAWVTRLALMAFVFGLAVINGVGVFSQLVAANVGERGAAAAAIETHDAELAARIEVTAHTVADFDTRVSQIDAAIAEATRRGRAKSCPGGDGNPAKDSCGARGGAEPGGGYSGSHQGRTRISGCERAPNRDRGGADPLRGGIGRRRY